MKSNHTLFLILTLLFQSCNTNTEHQVCDMQTDEAILGDWVRIYNNSSDETPPPRFLTLPQGMTITKDSIEYYLGFSKVEEDSVTGKSKRVLLGNYVAYKINNDSVFMLNPLNKDWEYIWKFLLRQNDTIELAFNDSTIIKFQKLHYILDTLADFDQIIYSSSGCYGFCPIVNISIDKKGNVISYGEAYVRNIGLFSLDIDVKTKNNIFEKFRRANPLSLIDKYAVDHTDDQSVSTTFIKNGEIVKTINDYGMMAPNELIWAYVSISNIQKTRQLDSLELDNPFYPILHYFTFKKEDLILYLKKSEKFYLWTELIKAKQTEKQFNPKYTIVFEAFYDNWKPKTNNEIDSITTDGQYFKIERKGKKSITYDLGYNFIERNFKTSDFRKTEEL